METQKVQKAEREKEYIPILKFVMILTEKGIPTTVDSVAGGMLMGSFDYKRDDQGNWLINKEEMVRRIKASGKKLPPIEADWYSIHGFIYELSKHDIDMHEDNICHLIAQGKMEAKRDAYNRFLVPRRELEKRVEIFGKQ